MRTPTTIPVNKLSIWSPYGRHGTAYRTMPNGFTTWAAETERKIATPGIYDFQSEFYGHDPAEEGRYRLHEFLTWWFTTGPEEKLAFRQHLEDLHKVGKIPVVYVASPVTELDEIAFRKLLNYLPDFVEIALDGASGEEKGSRCHRLVEEYGGPKRFWIEAHPRAEREHWHGYRLVYYASERVNVEMDNATGRPRTFDSYHPEIVLAWTGHKTRSTPLHPGGREATATEVKRWASRGLGIAVPEERRARLAEVVEVK